MITVISHEFMHVLGFNHEQNRGDQAQNVRIHWENIDPAPKLSDIRRIFGKIRRIFNFAFIRRFCVIFERFFEEFPNFSNIRRIFFLRIFFQKTKFVEYST